jgi:hypothetical protein
MEKVTLHADYTPLRASGLTKPNHLRGVPTAPGSTNSSWKDWTKLHGDIKTAERFPEKPGPPVVPGGAWALDPELAPAVRAGLG